MNNYNKNKHKPNLSTNFNLINKIKPIKKHSDHSNSKILLIFQHSKNYKSITNSSHPIISSQIKIIISNPNLNYLLTINPINSHKLPKTLIITINTILSHLALHHTISIKLYKKINSSKTKPMNLVFMKTQIQILLSKVFLKRISSSSNNKEDPQSTV